MDDALRRVDLDRRPVALHGGVLAAGDAKTCRLSPIDLDDLRSEPRWSCRAPIDSRFGDVIHCESTPLDAFDRHD